MRILQGKDKRVIIFFAITYAYKQNEIKCTRRVGRIAPFFFFILQKKTLSMSFRYEKDVVSLRYAV